MLQINKLFAETDNDAVGFYEHCGFDIVKFIKKADGKDFIRYKCTKT